MKAGIISLNKPKGITSHDVVNIVRRVSGIRKVGHAGALDPMATGVLLVCIGRATRLAEYLTVSDKGYLATVQLGVETDTYDADGQIVKTSTVRLERSDVEAALDNFRGLIEQVPPMYSAIKQGGKPLYKLARQGITVERESRQANISHLEMTDWAPPKFMFKVTCSAGTYVRSLVHDLGCQLKCGAHLTELVRIFSGQFRIEEAIHIKDLTASNWQSYLKQMDAAVSGFALINFDDDLSSRLIHGQAVPRLPEHPDVEMARAYKSDDCFFAMVKSSEDKTEWLPHKVFIG
ncbi:MAG: tRNA pseudouridine(55) synthase TruB [Anaerolineales bacterium]|nr:tRNA pseudouridine(55) synthase TruB [Anaerolineales bacterium]